MSVPVQRRGLVPCDAASFAKDAVGLARFLLGKYLLCPKSEVGLLRIIETEAYPVDDAVYKEVFGDKEALRPIPDRAGVLFMQRGFKLQADSSTDTDMWYRDYLYVTAEGSGEAGALRPVVLIRSCMPEFADFGLGTSTTNRAAIIATIENLLDFTDSTLPYFRKNLLINPYNVATALTPDFEIPNPSDPTLHADPGCRLFSSTDPQDPGPMLCGQRVLQDVVQDVEQKIRLQIRGASSMFRFVLDVTQKQYDFAERDALDPWSADQMVPDVDPPAQSSESVVPQSVPVRTPQVMDLMVPGIPKAVMAEEQQAVLGTLLTSMSPIQQVPVNPQ